MKFANEIRALRIVWIESVKLCGQRSYMDLNHYMWSSFEYYCANYAVIVLPTHVSDNNILYVRHTKLK